MLTKLNCTPELRIWITRDVTNIIGNNKKRNEPNEEIPKL